MLILEHPKPQHSLRKEKNEINSMRGDAKPFGEEFEKLKLEALNISYSLIYELCKKKSII